MTAKHSLILQENKGFVLAGEIITLKTTMNQREIVTQHYTRIKCH